MRWTMRSFLIRVLAVVVTAAFAFSLFFVGRVTIPRSVGGYCAQNKSYFVNSPTSRAVEKNSLSLFDLPFVQGEKSVFTCDDEFAFLASVMECFSADVLFHEEVDDTISYYAFSERLPKKVVVEGRFVNLHIAVKNGVAVVGTPIIYGSF